MEDYLVDRETLSKFVDELIKKKALNVESVDELDKIREDNIRTLDDEISIAIFNSLTDEQNEELSQLLDQDETADYQAFFAKNNIDIEKIITDTMTNFATEFLGGQDA